MKRQPDGTWRGAAQPVMASEAAIRARWFEAEVLHLKRMGISFESIADQITRIGRGQAQPLAPLPEGVGFPENYQVSRQACHKALKRGLARAPALAAEEFRKLDTARCEEMSFDLLQVSAATRESSWLRCFSPVRTNPEGEVERRLDEKPRSTELT